MMLINGLYSLDPQVSQNDNLHFGFQPKNVSPEINIIRTVLMSYYIINNYTVEQIHGNLIVQV